MPRPRSFDRDEMLDRAVVEFWRHGYNALGLDDLLGRIGLSRASMYNTFGTKTDFYAEALDRYRATEGDKFRARLDEADSAVQAVQQVFDLIVEQSIDPERPRGCFVVAATSERSSDDSRTATQVDEQLGILYKLFETFFDDAIEAGEFRPDFDTTRWARFVVSAIQGIRVIAASDPDETTLHDIAAANVTALATAARHATHNDRSPLI